nr:hypothetical protein [uncultured Mediterranean phage uvMED]
MGKQVSKTMLIYRLKDLILKCRMKGKFLLAMKLKDKLLRL